MLKLQFKKKIKNIKMEKRKTLSAFKIFLLCLAFAVMNNLTAEESKEEEIKPTTEDTICSPAQKNESVSQKIAVNKQSLPMTPSFNGVPMNLELDSSSGGKITLEQLMKDNKAILIDFWTSWCGACKKHMPELQLKASKLVPQGVQVVGMNLDSVWDARGIQEEKKIVQAIQLAERERKKQNIDFSWLVESPKGSYANLFQVDFVPQVVLLSNEGKILFKGHPADKRGLDKALSLLGAKI